MAEEPPASFDEFDELLARICPGISILQYRRLYNASVETVSYDASDYYSTRRAARYQCDLLRLWQALCDEGLVRSEPEGEPGPGGDSTHADVDAEAEEEIVAQAVAGFRAGCSRLAAATGVSEVQAALKLLQAVAAALGDLS